MMDTSRAAHVGVELERAPTKSALCNSSWFATHIHSMSFPHGERAGWPPLCSARSPGLAFRVFYAAGNQPNLVKQVGCTPLTRPTLGWSHRSAIPLLSRSHASCLALARANHVLVIQRCRRGSIGAMTYCTHR